MIERYIFARLHEDAAAPEALAELVETLRSGLGTVPGVRAVHIGRPADAHAAAGWDLSLRLTLDDAAAAETAIASPSYRAAVEDGLGSRAKVVKAWSFELA
jgi:hypothetical protein